MILHQCHYLTRLKRLFLVLRKLFVFSDSMALSISNFLITFFLLKFESYAGVVSFGIALTATLIIQSFQRAIILIPYNVTYDNKSRLLHSFIFIINNFSFLLFSSIVLMLIGLIFFEIDSVDFKVTVTLFAFLFVHESIRYLFLSEKYLIVVPVFSALLFCFIVALAFSSQLTLNNLIYLYSGLFFLELVSIVIYVYCNKMISLGMLKEGLLSESLWWRRAESLYTQALNSVSQLALVHLPFILASQFFLEKITAMLFVSRSIFQLVQIVIKSVESVDQRGLSNDLKSLRVIFKKLLVKYFFISFCISIICLIIASQVLTKFYPPEKIPDTWLLLPWLFVSVFLAISRSVEMIFYKTDNFKSVNYGYFFGSITTLILIVTAYFFQLDHYLSLCILIGWIITFIVHIYNAKKLNLIQLFRVK